MAPLPRASAIALVLACALAGCGDDDPTTTATNPPSATASGAVSTPPTSPTTATASPSGTAGGTAAPTPDSGATTGTCVSAGKVVPDGRWNGPITMDVRGGDGTSGFADSTGTGVLSMTVKNGKVTGGAWTVRWTSHGEADNGEASATVDLTGTVTGTVKGGAAKPVLPGTWSIEGITKVTKPVTTSVPFDETGKGSKTMTIKASTCDQVTGTFVPSFASKEASVTFSGTAEWVGTRR